MVTATRSTILSILVCCAVHLFAQFEQDIIDIINSPNSENAQFGISVVDQEGREVYAYQPNYRLIPASTFKLITTLSIVDMRGPTFRYRTQIGYTGTILKDGTLEGDLMIIGSGDPSLGSPHDGEINNFNAVLNEIVGWVKAQGITCIDGAVLIDDSIFDRVAIHPSWAWDDLTNYYTSGAWGFSIHENFYYLDFSRQLSSSTLTDIHAIRPVVRDLVIDNNVLTGAKGSGDNAYIYGNPYANNRWVDGTIPPGNDLFTIKGAIPNPGLFGAYHIRRALNDASIKANDINVVQDQKAALQLLGIIVSEPLSDMVKYANYTSNNLFCEAFFKLIGTSDGHQGSYTSAASTLEKYLSDEGLDISGIRIEDGSGLSSRNRISPKFMTSFLRVQHKKLGLDQLKQYIPKVGQQGSVRRFLNGYKAQKSSWLKSGSINNVQAYAGIIKTSTNQELFISLIANGHNSNRQLRAQMEKIIEVIYEEL